MTARRDTFAETPPQRAGDRTRRKISGAYDDIVISAVGLRALCDEMTAQGFDRGSLLAPIGLTPALLDDPASRISLRQKITFFRTIHRLSRKPGVGLRAAQRQRLQDFGVYGFALSSCPTLGDAIGFGHSHSRLAGSILERNLRLCGPVAVVEAHDVFELQEVLPLAAEFAFSTTNRLISLIMERPLKSLRLKLPYPAPAHANLYAEVFRCGVEFDADALELHLEASALAEPCPNASLFSERMCRSECDRILKSMETNEPAIVRALRAKLITTISAGNNPTVSELAVQLKISSRTLMRRLSAIGVSCQELIDDVRGRLAKEMLANTGLSVDEIAIRLGFFDASNFSKAFKRWTSETPAEYRKRVSWRGRFVGRIEPE